MPIALPSVDYAAGNGAHVGRQQGQLGVERRQEVDGGLAARGLEKWR
ncbi:MAG: hypothetical protein V4759_00370 [Pseudomonadota bacterium]